MPTDADNPDKGLGDTPESAAHKMRALEYLYKRIRASDARIAREEAHKAETVEEMRKLIHELGVKEYVSTATGTRIWRTSAHKRKYNLAALNRLLGKTMYSILTKGCVDDAKFDRLATDNPKVRECLSIDYNAEERLFFLGK